MHETVIVAKVLPLLNPGSDPASPVSSAFSLSSVLCLLNNSKIVFSSPIFYLRQKI